MFCGCMNGRLYLVALSGYISLCIFWIDVWLTQVMLKCGYLWCVLSAVKACLNKKELFVSKPITQTNPSKLHSAVMQFFIFHLIVSENSLVHLKMCYWIGNNYLQACSVLKCYSFLEMQTQENVICMQPQDYMQILCTRISLWWSLTL